MDIIDRAKNALGLGRGGAAAESAGDGRGDPRPSHEGTLQENAAKALRMKQDAGPQTNIPEHQTSHEGGVREPQVGYTDTAVGREPTHASNLKRSHNARSGDGS